MSDACWLAVPACLIFALLAALLCSHSAIACVSWEGGRFAVPACLFHICCVVVLSFDCLRLQATEFLEHNLQVHPKFGPDTILLLLWLTWPCPQVVCPCSIYFSCLLPDMVDMAVADIAVFTITGCAYVSFICYFLLMPTAYRSLMAVVRCWCPAWAPAASGGESWKWWLLRWRCPRPCRWVEEDMAGCKGGVKGELVSRLVSRGKIAQYINTVPAVRWGAAWYGCLCQYIAGEKRQCCCYASV